MRYLDKRVMPASYGPAGRYLLLGTVVGCGFGLYIWSKSMQMKNSERRKFSCMKKSQQMGLFWMENKKTEQDLAAAEAAKNPTPVQA